MSRPQVMPNAKKCIYIGLSCLLLAFFGASHAQHNHSHGAPPTDTRVVVDFPPAMKEHTLSSMRDHLLAISQIQEAIGNAKYDVAASIAETRLGQTALKAHHAKENSAFMPTGMQELGTQMHRNASKFAIEIQTASATGDIKPALLLLSKTTQACVACHAGYKLK